MITTRRRRRWVCGVEEAQKNKIKIAQCHIGRLVLRSGIHWDQRIL